MCIFEMAYVIGKYYVWIKGTLLYLKLEFRYIM